jgi:hypothetical protein
MASAVARLLHRFALDLHTIADGQAIAGSYWGECEAGLIGTRLRARADTPVHSVLHEMCHYICMDPQRRAILHTDAGGSVLEDCAVCYLSIVLADSLPDYSRQQMLNDMDRWGYSFRLGSAAIWFHDDARDAAQWLQEHTLLNANHQPSWRLRT